MTAWGKRYRNVLKIVLFCAIVLLLGNRMLGILSYKPGEGGGWQRFYDTKRGKMDVVFFGSSHAHCTIDHKYLWENYGIAGYTLSAGSQKIDSTLYFVKETLRTQNPKVLVVEMLGAIGGELQNTDTDVYRNALGMAWSENLWNFTNYLADNMGMDNTWRNGIFLKIPVIHSRYAELTKSDFRDPIPFMRGYRGSFDIDCHERPAAENNYEVKELDPGRKAILEQIIMTAKAKNVPIVLFAAPYDIPEEEQMQYNAIEAIAAENDVPFLNFNHLYEETGLDFTTDLRDGAHVNNDGAVKITRYLADFLKENYEIPDRRGEVGYELWEQNARYLRNKEIRHELETSEDINAYLQRIAELEPDRTVILALTGNYGALGDVYLEKLLQLGLTREDYETGGAWLFREGRIAARMPGQEYSRCFSTASGELHLESVLQTTDQDVVDQVCLLVNGEDYRMVQNGVNLIVYDESLDMVIDAAGDDIYLGLEMTHNEKPDE